MGAYVVQVGETIQFSVYSETPPVVCMFRPRERITSPPLVKTQYPLRLEPRFPDGGWVATLFPKKALGRWMGALGGFVFCCGGVGRLVVPLSPM